MESAQCINELSRSSEIAKLYANKSVVKVLDELDTCAADYAGGIEDVACEANQKQLDVSLLDKAIFNHAKMTKKIDEVKSHLLEEMKKDLGVK